MTNQNKNHFRSPSRITKIIHEISINAGTEKINPHSVQLLHLVFARKIIRGQEEEKAIIQNVRLENLPTTFNYGNFSQVGVKKLISKINSRNRKSKKSFKMRNMNYWKYEKFHEKKIKLLNQKHLMLKKLQHFRIKSGINEFIGELWAPPKGGINEVK